MRTLRVLLHHGASVGPSLQLVDRPDGAAAQELADDILTAAQDGVGVEVWRGEQRLYARGVVPWRDRRADRPA